MKIVHIITGLGDGGAEHTLYKVCKYDIKNTHIVISLRDTGKYYKMLKNLGIKTYCLNFKFFSVIKFLFLVKLLKSLTPDIVQTWLVHADFLGGIASKLAKINNIIWNVRYSRIDFGKAKLITVLIVKILVILSFKVPKTIIFVSKRAKKIYEALGYDKRKFKFIPNGYDFSILKNDKIKKNLFRNKFKLSKQIPIIGKVARYDPVKDHSNLLNSLQLLRLKKIDFLCLLIGSNIQKNTKLLDQIRKLRLTKYVKLLRPEKNISKIMNCLDIHVLSSSAEGFPNVVAEAMAFKTPCVVTNVGDASYIVGKTGWVVPPKNSLKLAFAIEKAIHEFKGKSWNLICNRARLRIRKKFNIHKMIRLYNIVWAKNNKTR